MGFWPITFTVEWVLAAGLGLIFLVQKGKVTRAFSAVFFVLSSTLPFAPQYFMTYDGGTFAEAALKVYPTPIIQIMFAIHMGLIAMALEFLFDDLDRDVLGRAPKDSGRRFSKR